MCSSALSTIKLCPLKHGDVIVRIAHGGGIGDINAELLAQMRDAGALVDTQVHKVDPLAPGVGDVELVRELRAIGLAECGLGVVAGTEILLDSISMPSKVST